MRRKRAGVLGARISPRLIDAAGLGAKRAWTQARRQRRRRRKRGATDVALYGVPFAPRPAMMTASRSGHHACLAQLLPSSRGPLPPCSGGNASLCNWRHPRTLRLPRPTRTTSSIATSRERGARDQATEIYIGDYVDRGPDSKGVIDRLIARSTKARLVALRGNHEIMMESFLRGQTPFEDWRRLGGLETILSYGVDARGLLAKGGVSRATSPKRFPFRICVSFRRWRACTRLAAIASSMRGSGLASRSSGSRSPTSPGSATTSCAFPGRFGFIVVHGHIAGHKRRLSAKQNQYRHRRLHDQPPIRPSHRRRAA